MKLSDGSSPRVWGIQDAERAGAGGIRFIPTRVGNTIRSAAASGILQVHPHACGEYGFGFTLVRRDVGSSPRVWGIHPPTKSRRRATPVHPHACGEYDEILNFAPLVDGSSPRVWGIRRLARRGAITERFIPTRVGNTVR